MMTHSPSESGLIVTVARKLIRENGIATLATIDRDSGHPYASLTAAATDLDGSPITLVSDLSVHTQNLKCDSRASILFASPAASGDPLDSGRVSVTGTIEPTHSPSCRARFLLQHPEASIYADFNDFSFRRMNAIKMHYVGGFGQVATLLPADVLVDAQTADHWITRHDEIASGINRNHSALLARLADHAAPNLSAPVEFGACDPDGCYLRVGGKPFRIGFAERIASPDGVIPALETFGAGQPAQLSGKKT